MLAAPNLHHDEGDKPLASSTTSFLPYERVTAHQPNRTIRLVDGPYVHEGIVQGCNSIDNLDGLNPHLNPSLNRRPI